MDIREEFSTSYTNLQKRVNKNEALYIKPVHIPTNCFCNIIFTSFIIFQDSSPKI